MKGINLKQPHCCRLCGEGSVQQVTRTHPVRFGDDVPTFSGLIAHRCGGGHIFLTTRLMHEEIAGSHEDTRHSNHAEILSLQKKLKRLNDALRLLFDLLEEYSPLWYTKEHHDQADEALQLDEKSLL
jgi:hypothetical protein